MLRAVGSNGCISSRGCAILCGRGIAGHRVRVEPRDRDVAVFSCCWKAIRTLSHEQLTRGSVL